MALDNTQTNQIQPNTQPPLSGFAATRPNLGSANTPANQTPANTPTNTSSPANPNNPLGGLDFSHVMNEGPAGLLKTFQSPQGFTTLATALRPLTQTILGSGGLPALASLYGMFTNNQNYHRIFDTSIDANDPQTLFPRPSTQPQRPQYELPTPDRAGQIHSASWHFPLPESDGKGRLKPPSVEKSAAWYDQITPHLGYGLAGAGVGAGLGALSQLFREKKKRNYLGGMLTGGLLGGLGGGLGSYFLNPQQAAEQTPPQPDSDNVAESPGTQVMAEQPQPGMLQDVRANAQTVRDTIQRGLGGMRSDVQELRDNAQNFRENWRDMLPSAGDVGEATRALAPPIAADAAGYGGMRYLTGAPLGLLPALGATTVGSSVLDLINSGRRAWQAYQRDPSLGVGESIRQGWDQPGYNAASTPSANDAGSYLGAGLGAMNQAPHSLLTAAQFGFENNPVFEAGRALGQVRTTPGAQQSVPEVAQRALTTMPSTPVHTSGPMFEQARQAFLRGQPDAYHPHYNPTGFIGGPRDPNRRPDASYGAQNILRNMLPGGPVFGSMPGMGLLNGLFDRLPN